MSGTGYRARGLTYKRNGITINGMRQKLSKEVELQQAVKKIILETARQTEKAVYLSPTRVVSLLHGRGIKVSVAFVIRRYEELEIYNENGLWLRRI